MRSFYVKRLLQSCSECLARNYPIGSENGIIDMTACAISEEVTSKSEEEIKQIINDWWKGFEWDAQEICALALQIEHC